MPKWDLSEHGHGYLSAYSRELGDGQHTVLRTNRKSRYRRSKQRRILGGLRLGRGCMSIEDGSVHTAIALRLPRAVALGGSAGWLTRRDRGAAWDLRRWGTFREHTLVISRERRTGADWNYADTCERPDHRARRECSTRIIGPATVSA